MENQSALKFLKYLKSVSEEGSVVRLGDSNLDLFKVQIDKYVAEYVWRIY